MMRLHSPKSQCSDPLTGCFRAGLILTQQMGNGLSAARDLAKGSALSSHQNQNAQFLSCNALRVYTLVTEEWIESLLQCLVTLIFTFPNSRVFPFVFYSVLSLEVRMIPYQHP